MRIDRAEEIIARTHPEFAGCSVEYLGEGDSCSAFLVNGEWVFRFAKNERAAAGLAREACVLPRIASLFDVRIPVPEFLTTDSLPVFSGYRMLRGPALTRSKYLEFDVPARDKCACDVALFLRQMHSVNLTAARDCGVKVTDYNSQYGWLIPETRKYFSAKLTTAEIRFVEHVVTNYFASPVFREYSPVLLHGDLSPDHVLYDEDSQKVTGIIDFGDIAIGDPAWDLVFIYEDYGKDFFNRMLPVYASGDTMALLTRMYRLLILNTFEWAVDCAEKSSGELDAALDQIRRFAESAAF
jgi:aminoglycoside 2''-phosphotransferase